MDAGAIAAAALLEAAQNNQKIVEASTEKLEALIKVLREMPREITPELKAAIEKAHREELAATRQEFHALTTNLRYARERMARLWLLIGAGVVMVAVLSVAAVLAFVLPSGTEIQALRHEKEDLETTIVRLQGQGGRAKLRTCGDPGKAQRLCVLVDPGGGFFGNAVDRYMVIKGY